MLHRFATQAMACRFEIVLEAVSPVWAAAVAEDALAEICLWDRKLSRYDSASDVSRLNRDAWQRPVRVDGEMFALLTLCRQGIDLTGGLFCPLGTGLVTLELDVISGTVRFVRRGDAQAAPSPWHGLNMGAIGKGWALERAATVLRQHGVTCALLHGGTSSVVAIGAPQQQNGPDHIPGWRIRVGEDAAASTDAAAGAALVVPLNDESLSVSAHHGRAGGHVVDPRSGELIRPVPPSAGTSPEAGIPAAATSAVVHTSGAWSEIWSTALLLDPQALPSPPTAPLPPAAPSFAAVRATGGWRTIHDRRARSTPLSVTHRSHLEGSSNV
jgi:thiamine biosynthesis lipoprotein